MAIVVLIAGVVFILAGLAQVVYGIPVKEFSFGNTLMLTGTVTACTGAILIGIWIAIREFGALALGAVAAPRPAAAFKADSSPATPREAMLPGDAFEPNLSAPATRAEPVSAPPPIAPPPWHEETASRDRTRVADAPPAEPAEPVVKQRRNLLFSSTSRKERERAEARMVDAPAAGNPPDSIAAPSVVPPPSRPGEASPASFEEAWPQRRGGGRAPATSTEAGPDTTVPDRGPAPPRIDEPAPVTVLKSGVVDGMAYSLYSDGSIEAQMPEGMMRFASIDELRAHLDQRG